MLAFSFTAPLLSLTKFITFTDTASPKVLLSLFKPLLSEIRRNSVVAGKETVG